MACDEECYRVQYYVIYKDTIKFRDDKASANKSFKNGLLKTNTPFL